MNSLEQNIHRVRERVAAACDRVGRDPTEVVLVAVSKTHSLEVIQAAYDCGIRDFGENRPQELKTKCVALRDRPRMPELRWHMIGHVQRNKAVAVASCAEVIHSVDSVRLAQELSRRCTDSGRVIQALVQVNISAEEQKHGFDPESVSTVLPELADLKGISVVGLMGMARLVGDPEEVRAEFRSLARLKNEWNQNPLAEIDLIHLSMGMTLDFEVAIEEGATMVRVGTAIFGKR